MFVIFEMMLEVVVICILDIKEFWMMEILVLKLFEVDDGKIFLMFLMNVILRFVEWFIIFYDIK